MRASTMSQDGSQSSPLAGLSPSMQDVPRRTQTKSSRDHIDAEKEGQRSRASSIAKSDHQSENTRVNKARSPINEAVQSALDPLDLKQSSISPDLIDQITSQITANVLQKLKTTQLTPQPTQSTTNNVPDQGHATTSINGSPSFDRDKAQSPPSPYRASVEAAQSTSVSSPRRQSRYSGQSPGGQRSPSPRSSYETSYRDADGKEKGSAATAAEEATADGDITIHEKIWGNLFDDKGQLTTRMSLFLRGIAVHLIEDYEPKHSLVITPDKLQRYYEATKLSDEVYPWQVVFDDRTSSISRMFREIEAQHHLVQDRLCERPDIPGLTPMGFETWMALVLKAHPDEEFERLAYTALHMPVNNPDDRKERFPKELSRRQFPKEADQLTGSKLQKLVFTHCGVKITSRNGNTSDRDTRAAQVPMATSLPPTVQQKSPQPENSLSQTPTRSSVTSDVDRNVLRSVVSDVTGEGHTDDPCPPPIERERKPYVAQPGGGKTHDILDTQVPREVPESKVSQSGPPTATRLTRSASVHNDRAPECRARLPPPIAIHQKSSATTAPMTAPIPPPIDIPPTTRTRAGSLYHKDGVPRRGDRNRSPSISRTNGTLHRSDADVSYLPTGSSDYSSSSWKQDTRYEPRGSFSSETRDRDRDRDREARQRYHSSSNGDNYRHNNSNNNNNNKDYSSDDEYYRPRDTGYLASDIQYGSPQQYPPNSYRSRA